MAPWPLSNFESITVPRASVSGLALSSSTSPSNRMELKISSIPSPVLAETSTA